MAGNARFELTSASPDSSFGGNYQNGQRGYSDPSLDRSTSFRDGTESRNFASGKTNSRANATSPGDVTTLSQILLLEPIAMEQKHARSSDIRKVLGSAVGTSSEDNSFGTTHGKNIPPGALEELKRVRASVADSCVKASCRAKKLDDQLIKLNKCIDVMPSKKQQQRVEMLANERSSGSVLKIGSVMHRNPAEFGSQKFDDRPKNGLNKRLRTSVAETRADCRNNGVLRQTLTGTKDRDLLKDSNVDSDIVEEKIRRLPAGGEGWDKKMKRKRSVGAVFPRSVDNDGEPKRTMHHKLTSESSLQSNESTHSFRSGASGSSNRLDPTSSPAGSNIRTTFKSEQEKSTLARDVPVGPIKERTMGKLNIRMNNREDNHATCPSPVLKGKASRAPRSGSMVTANSNSSVPRMSGTLESWEQPQAVNRSPTIGGTTNRKRSMPAGSSSQPITQWVGQRPQKIQRTRRTNLIPVSSHDDVHMQTEGGSPSDFSPRCTTSASLPTRSSGSGNQNSKAKSENAPSPARLSESEESGAGQNRIKEKGVGSADVDEKDGSTGQNVGPSAIPIKKNKIIVKEEIGDGVRRQGRSGRVSPFSRDSISPTTEKLDAVGPMKPVRNARSGSDKNASKSGRPLKKLSDRKGISRLGHVANGSSPDCSGESEDDHEELIMAANLACNSSSVNACSSAFWKMVEPVFAPVGPDEKKILSEQDDYGHEEIEAPDSLCFGRYGHVKIEMGLKNSSDRVNFAEQKNPSVFKSSEEAEKTHEIVTPLYHRVLSALIEEDEIEESEETGFGRPRISVTDSCLLIDAESKPIDKRDLFESTFGVQTQKNGNRIIFSCNGNADFDRDPSSQDRLCNGELLPRDGGCVHSEFEVLVRLSRCDYVPESMQTKNCGVASFHGQFEQMCVEDKLVIELQSVGIFIDPVPALDDKEDEATNDEIIQLERGLSEQIEKKKSRSDKLYKTIQEGKDTERRDPEQIAMDHLVELAYKKLLATRSSYASKHGISKVLKQAALGFAKRTLTRCRKYEVTGKSCFSDPPLRDIIFAPPPRSDVKELLTGANVTVANGENMNPVNAATTVDGSSIDAFDTSIHQSDQAFAKNGPISNRAKRKELLLDDVGGAVFRASSALGILDSAKGKRSGGRSSLGGSKSKLKQKTAQLSTSANGYVNKLNDTTNSLASPSGEAANKKKDVRFMSSGNNPQPSSNEIKEPLEYADMPLDNLDELGVDSEIGGPQDLNSWLNFDIDGLQDHDSIGLEIPMDDLTGLDMF